MKRPGLASFCSKVRSATGRFKRDKRGVTSIEFAFVVGPFLAITLGTMEVALVHLMRSSVSNAVEAAARPIYTGSAGCATVESVKTEICSRIAMKTEESCKADLRVILEELNGFDGDRIDPADNFEDIQEAVDPGGAESTMLLRTYYNWKIMFPLLADTLGGDNGALVLTATTAFRNEPYGTSTGCQAPS